MGRGSCPSHIVRAWCTQHCHSPRPFDWLCFLSPTRCDPRAVVFVVLVKKQKADSDDEADEADDDSRKPSPTNRAVKSKVRRKRAAACAGAHISATCAGANVAEIADWKWCAGQEGRLISHCPSCCVYGCVAWVFLAGGGTVASANTFVHFRRPDTETSRAATRFPCSPAADH